MRVRYLFGPRKGEVVDMPSAHAKQAIKAHTVEPETPPLVSDNALVFSEEEPKEAVQQLSPRKSRARS